MERLVWVCVGSALGGGARYLMSLGALRLLGPGFPVGTLAVNVLGSFLISAIMYIGLTTTWISPGMRIFLTTGVMGGFTTYSTFNYETLALATDGEWLFAFANVGATLFGCIAAGLLGVAVARLAVGH